MGPNSRLEIMKATYDAPIVTNRSEIHWRSFHVRFRDKQLLLQLPALAVLALDERVGLGATLGLEFPGVPVEFFAGT